MRRCALRRRLGRAFATAVLVLSVGAAAPAQDPTGDPTPAGAEPVAASPRIELPARWDLLLDKDNAGSLRGLPGGTGPAWDGALRVAVPGPFECNPQAARYDGAVWYRCALPEAQAPPGGRLFLQFEEANWRAEAWLDGSSLGRHDGHGSFRFDVSGRLDDPGHVRVVRVVDAGDKLVDGLLLAALPTGREGSSCNVGGLLGAVSLRPTGAQEILRHDARLLPDGSAQLRVDVANHDAEPRDVALHGDVAGVTGEMQVTLPPGESSHLLAVPGAELLPRWSPESPARHPVALSLRDPAGAVLAQAGGLAGFRRFAAEGAQFVLDGEPIRLHGVGYAPFYPKGLSSPPDAGFLRRDLGAVKAAGFNLVRVEQRIAPEVWELCDELGLLVHAEPPLGHVAHELPITAPAVDEALAAFAQAVQGHPSVVLVSVLDEGGGMLWRRGPQLLRRAQDLLPERLLLSDSNGTTGATRLLNPHDPQAAPACADVRLDLRWPWDAERFEGLAGDGRLTYVSRWSAGGLPAFVDDVSGFAGGLATEDAAGFVQRLQDAVGQIAGTPLGQVVRDLPHLTSLGQMAHARAVRAAAAALHADGALAGECYASWRDVASPDAEGLCDAWGRAKPALAAMRTCGSPPSVAAELPARTPQAIATGSLVGLSPGVAAVVEPLFMKPGTLAGMPHIAIVGERRFGWNAETQALTVGLLRFARDGGTLLLLAPPDAGRPLDNDLPSTILGGQVADLPVDVAARPLHRPGAHGLLLFAEKSLLLADLPLEAPVVDERLALVAPDQVLYAPPSAAPDVELAAIDGGGRYLGAAVQAVPYGKGHLVLSTLRFTDESLADPAAARLLENLVRYTASLAARKPVPAVTATEPPDVALREPIRQHLWRYRIWFGLAERQATANVPGMAPRPRGDPPDLATMVARKNTGLDLIVQGKAAEGDRILAMIDGGALAGDRELFLRNEMACAEALRQRATASQPLLPAERLELGGRHARALWLLRLGEVKAGIAVLDQALADLRAATAVAEPAEASAPAPPDRAGTDGTPPQR